MGLGFYVFAATLFLATAARAQTPSPPPPPIEGLRVSADVGYAPTLFSTPNDASVGLMVAALCRGDTLELAGGMRGFAGAIDPPLGASAFVRGGVGAAYGVWRPSLALELEATTAMHAAIDTAATPVGSLVARTAVDDAKNTLRTALVIAPLRFQWDQLFIGGPALRVATPLSRGEIGERIYATVALAEIGWTL